MSEGGKLKDKVVVSLSFDLWISQWKAKGGKVNQCRNLVWNVKGKKWSNEGINMLFSDFRSERWKTDFRAEMTLVVVEWIFQWWNNYHIGPYV